ncbi:UDP-glucose dehydrogenase family protein [Paenibacillus alvei]|uniref:UDP-glucose 6-dehydrogenase n=1 Tax=Paenibacillus alvei TaxID=44250 RepID=A0A383RBH4_PAEAL|nr:UDP-glucose/GDP-mannose dehydrogenase family protein [Paenibacillus alvei]SYX83636.1 UDP-glucose 6-dehydrogenase TuaD [Paenibacillus alvei]
MDILVIGLGYVGTTTALAFAENGWKIAGFDTDHSKLCSLEKGDLPFYEPGLGELLQKYVDQGNIQFVSDAKEAIEKHHILFICVGTPSREDGSADLTYIQQVSEWIGQHMQEHKVIVVKSTVPVGTQKRIKEWVANKQTKPITFDVVSNPEFLREGSALHDALHPDRIILGSDSQAAADVVSSLYRSYTCPIIRTEPSTAELIKYASNAFLATKISYVNELARLCDQCGVSITDVAQGMGLDPRIGSSFLRAGIGYGGSCFPKDVNALLTSAEQYGIHLSLLEKVVHINRTQYAYFLTKLTAKLGTLDGKKVAILGLAFKPGTDDLREAPSLAIITQLWNSGATISVHDPVAALPPNYPTARLTQYPHILDALHNADAAIICTEWAVYESMNWSEALPIMRTPILLDGRNMLRANEMQAIGYDYEGVGGHK